MAQIRTARSEDIPTILALGEQFGHLMLYQKDPEVMRRYTSRILVAEEPMPGEEGRWNIVGYYHYIVEGDPGFAEMLSCYRQFPVRLTLEAQEISRLCVCMQGASHREIFRQFIEHLQESWRNVWCYCSAKSRRVETYKELGFEFRLRDEFHFFNIHKGDYSSYKLGRWESRRDPVYKLVGRVEGRLSCGPSEQTLSKVKKAVQKVSPKRLREVESSGNL